MTPTEWIAAVAKDIANLPTEQFPQLADFSESAHLEADALKISYGYRTHDAEHAGGWTASVPNPDEDGVWFYIDLHDPDSTRQIHTQPMVPKWKLGDHEVMFLILEGKDTPSLSGKISAIFERHGATPGSLQ